VPLKLIISTAPEVKLCNQPDEMTYDVHAVTFAVNELKANNN